MGIENICQHDPSTAVHWSIKNIHFFELWNTKLCTVSYISNLRGIKVVFDWMTKLQLQSKPFLSKQITSNSIVSSKHLYYYCVRLAWPQLWRRQLHRQPNGGFLPKNLNQLVIFVVRLAFTWLWVNKNRAQFQKTN